MKTKEGLDAFQKYVNNVCETIVLVRDFFEENPDVKIRFKEYAKKHRDR